MIDHDIAAGLAALMLRFGRIRTEEFPPALFGEPAWGYLLELFVADAHGVSMTGRQIGERLRISDNVASRWLMHLTAERLIIGDGSGDVDDELTLSGSAMAQMERFLQKVGNINFDRFI